MDDAVALIEINQSQHDECLYAQIRFLQAYGIKVHLIVSRQLHDRRLDARHGADFLEVLPIFQGKWWQWRLVSRVFSYIKTHRIRQAVLNTAQGQLAWKMSLIAPRSVEMFGTVHHARKLVEWSTTQAIISRKIKKYFVLNDYIVDELRRHRIKSQVSSFYPIYFPMPAEPINTQGQFVVAIPGQLHFKRRDYAGLISALVHATLDPRVRFVLLGDALRFDGPEIRLRLKETGLESRFICFDRFIDYSTMLGYLAVCDLVLPLVHPVTEEYENHLRYQISGSFSLAQAVRKPMLMHESFAQIEDFQRGAVFYLEADLVGCLNQLVQEPVRLQGLRQNLATYAKFDFDFQARHYVGFLQPGRFVNVTKTAN